MGSICLACSQLIPIILYVCYAYTLIFLGAFALIEDEAVRDQACGKAYPVWNYCCLNTICCFVTIITYCFWRGGGEGARVRALALIVVLFALFMWGLLMEQRISDPCDNIFWKNFHVLYIFYHICMYTNGVFFFLFTLHECLLGKQLGSDLTIMASVRHRYNTPNRAPQGPQAPPGGLPPKDFLHPPTSSPASVGLPPQLNYEYEKIMQGTKGHPSASGTVMATDALSFAWSSSSSLPQTTP